MYSDPPSVQDRPRNKEHRLHVKDHEQHGHDIKPHGISSARITCRRNPEIIGLELRADGSGGRPDEFRQDQGYGGKCYNQRRVNQHWNVGALHHSLTRSILSPPPIVGRLTFRKAALRRGWWLSQPP